MAIAFRRSAPALVAVAHGTRRPEGPRSIDALLDRVRSLRPELRVEVAYVELVEPGLPEVLDRVGRRNAVVVPLLLGNGYHLVNDVAAVAAPAPVAPALGPHPRLAQAMADRLREAGDTGRGPVVLAAAGSSDRQSRADTEVMGSLLSARLDRRVTVAYNSAAAPRVTETVASLRELGTREIAVATYLLAPGRFSLEVAECGADVVSAPLGTHDAVAALILHRYDAARAGLSVVVPPPAAQLLPTCLARYILEFGESGPTYRSHQVPRTRFRVTAPSARRGGAAGQMAVATSGRR